MKLEEATLNAKQEWSLPVRGAWIEIRCLPAKRRRNLESLPVRGAWIEIRWSADLLQRRVRRSPCGERGLKWLAAKHHYRRVASLPVRGAWIEILLAAVISSALPVAPRAGSVD